MNRIIGDRREKSALDEMEEVARQFNEECNEEEKRKAEALRKKKEEAERKAKETAKAPSKPVKSSSGSIIPADYRRLEFEAEAPKGFDHKALVSYGISLARLKMAGYERHASPSEAFSLLIDNLEGKLKGKYKAVAEDMLEDIGEWLSMAMERKGDTLICYLHPEGLVWNGSGYIQQGFEYDGKQEFNISGKKSRTWISISSFDDEFVKLIYGRSFNDLPKEMREGNRNKQIFLPPENVLGPVCCNYFDYYKLIVSSYDYILSASRGVRARGLK